MRLASAERAYFCGQRCQEGSWAEAREVCAHLLNRPMLCTHPSSHPLPPSTLSPAQPSPAPRPQTPSTFHITLTLTRLALAPTLALALTPPSSVQAGEVIRQLSKAFADEQILEAELDSGSEYLEVMAEAARCFAEGDYRRAGMSLNYAIALEPDEPEAYYNLGVALTNTGRHGKAAESFLKAAARDLYGSAPWADSMAAAFNNLQMPECDEMVKPSWWNDEALKALSKAVVDAGVDSQQAHQMRAKVLSGTCPPSCKAGPRSAADLREAAKHSERAAELVHAPIHKSKRERFATALLNQAAAMEAAEAVAKAEAVPDGAKTSSGSRRRMYRHRCRT